MKITLLSPRHGRGLTTVSALLADMASKKYGIPCMLTHTGARDEAMDSYMSLTKGMDKTMNFRQIVKLSEVGEITGSDLKDYTVKRGKLNIFNPNGEEIDDEKGNMLLMQILKTNVHGLTFIDVTGELTDPGVESILADSDFHVIVLNQSMETINQLKYWKEYGYWDKIEQAGYIIIINCFNNNIMALDKVAKLIGAKRNRVFKLHYNPLIVKQANEGTLLISNEYALVGDPRYVQIKTDLLECLKAIAANLGLAYKWR